MTVEIQLDDAEAHALRQKAEAVGQELTAYVGALLRREARRPPRTLSEIAADVERRRGGPLDVSEEELGEMLEVAKHEGRADRRNRSAP